MDAARVLAAVNGRILRAYSRRTTDALRAALPQRMALPHLEPTLALNVRSARDALVIHRAERSSPPGAHPVTTTCNGSTTRPSSRPEFLAHSSVSGRYRGAPRQDAPVRLERQPARRGLPIWASRRRRHAAALRFLRRRRDQHWQERCACREETRLLSHAVELPKLLVPAREKIARRLLHIMNEVGARLAGDLARLVYRDR